jgi:hypothetical protein
MTRCRFLGLLAALAVITLTAVGNASALNFLMTSGPGVSSWDSGRVDVFARGTDNALWHRSYDVTGWSPWESLGGQITSDPAAVSRANGVIDVFATGTDSALYHWAFGSQGWAPLEMLSPVGYVAPGSGPAVASWGSLRLDVFVRTAAGSQLGHKSWENGWWSEWEPLGGYLVSDPAAVSWGPNRIDVFAASPGPPPCGGCAPPNELIHAWWDGAGWRGWDSMGGALSSSPGVASWGENRLDVFVRGTDNALYQRFFVGGPGGSGWSDWVYHGGDLHSTPDAVSWGPGRVDVFFRGVDGGLWQRYFESGWQGWQSLDQYPPAGQEVFATTTQTYVDVTNNDARWRIYKRCAEGYGPGYVAKAVMTSGQELLNDNQGSPHSNGSGIYIGLGKFVFRHARAAQGTEDLRGPPQLAWDLNGGVCDLRGVNADASDAAGMPAYDPASDSLRADFSVQFRDPDQPDLLQIAYKWKFYPSFLKMWAVVTPRCDGFSCGGAQPAWIKGPKFVAGLNGKPDGVGFSQITTYDASLADSPGAVLCVNRNRWPGNFAGDCAYPTRTRFQFNYALSSDVYDPRCTANIRCFNAVFRSYPAGAAPETPGAARPWTADPQTDAARGLHAWAFDVCCSWASVNNVVPESCSQLTGPWTNGALQWEAPGARADRVQTLPYEVVSGFAFGWRDCVQTWDNGRLFRRYNLGPSYGTYASFSFNNNFAPTIGG